MILRKKKFIQKNFSYGIYQNHFCTSALNSGSGVMDRGRGKGCACASQCRLAQQTMEKTTIHLFSFRCLFYKLCLFSLTMQTSSPLMRKGSCGDLQQRYPFSQVNPLFQPPTLGGLWVALQTQIHLHRPQVIFKP